MAAYDYRCPKCGNVREVNHSMNNSPLVVCDCGMQMDRVISGGTGVHYYGPGFTKARKPSN